MKLLFENTKNIFLADNFISDNYLLKIIFPIKIFQFLGVIFYQLIGYSILFKLVFRTSENFKNQNMENIDEKFTSQEKLRMIFIILFSFFSSFNINEPKTEETHNFTPYKFILNIIQALICLTLAFFIGNFVHKRVSKDSTLIFTSITFLLLSVDGAIKLFSY